MNSNRIISRSGVLSLLITLLLGLAHMAAADVLDDFEDGDYANNPSWDIVFFRPGMGLMSVVADPLDPGNLVLKGHGDETGHHVIGTDLETPVPWEGVRFSMDILASSGDKYHPIIFLLTDDLSYRAGIGMYYDWGAHDRPRLRALETGSEPFFPLPDSIEHPTEEWYRISGWIEAGTQTLHVELRRVADSSLLYDLSYTLIQDLSTLSDIAHVWIAVEEYGWQHVDNVTLSANNPPVAVCKDVTLALDENGEATLTASDVNDGSYDPDGDDITPSIDKTDFTCPDIGESTVTLTVSDGQETDQCTATVTVVDVTPPTTSCPSNIVVECMSPNGSVVGFDVITADNCDASPTVTCTPEPGSVFPIGTTEVTCTAIDSSGNSSNCSFTITVTEGYGTVAGQVFASCEDGVGLLNISVDAYDPAGDLAASTCTDPAGVYELTDLASGQSYTITIVPPLGYSAGSEELSTDVRCGETSTVGFDVTCVDIIAQPRTIGFWKHQVGVATGGNGNAQIDGATLCDYLDLIENHFNSNAFNQVIVYQPPASGLCEEKLLELKSLLNLKGSQVMIDRAKQQLMALLLNVASGKLSQTEIISVDSATVSQAITYCDNLIDDPEGDHETVKTICDDINNNKQVAAGVIPLSTADIAYKQTQVPFSFNLAQNYPNPFNPTTEISFSLPMASEVKMEIFNILGQKVTTLLEQQLEAGEHIVRWDGSSVASGVYLYRLQAGDLVATKKMVLLK